MRVRPHCRILSLLLFLAALFLGLTFPAVAQWSTDISVNTPVCTATGDQTGTVSVTDGSGGIIIAWVDGRGTNPNIYLQRLDASGIAQWAANGIPIWLESAAQSSPGLVSDGAGGALISWLDTRSGSFMLYIQRISADGNSQWQSGGILVTGESVSQYQLASDFYGGAILAWGSRAQRFDPNGQSLWAPSGVVVCDSCAGVMLASDRSGSVVAWADRVQKIDVDGKRRWLPNGRTIIPPDLSNLYDEAIASDDQGGIGAVWVQDIYGYGYLSPADSVLTWCAIGQGLCAQRIDSTGRLRWGPDSGTTPDDWKWHVDSSHLTFLWQSGTPCGPKGSIGNIVCGTTGAGGRIAVAFNMDAHQWHVAGAIFDIDGVFDMNGLIGGPGQNPVLVTDRKGGVYISTPILDGSIGSFSLYAWWGGGVGVTNAVIGPVNVPGSITITPTGSGGGIIAWADTRNGTDYNIYAQIVTEDGALPIQLAGLVVTFAGSNLVEVNWSTLSEIDNYGFDVQKAQALTGPYHTVPNSFIPAHRTTLIPHSYSFVDVSGDLGTWYYRLKQTDLDGSVHYSEAVEVTVGNLPSAFALEQNYPNPFNPSTTIRYELPNSSMVRLSVYDILGREVSVLVNERKNTGSYEVTFDGSALASGVYLCRFEAGRFVATKKLVLVR